MSSIANLSGIKVLSEEKYNELPSTPEDILHFVELPIDAYITESYVDGNDWYIVYSNGLCLQGGNATRSAATQTVAFYKSYSQLLGVFLGTYHTSDSTDGRPPLIRNASTTQFTLNLYTAYAGAYWYAIGYC